MNLLPFGVAVALLAMADPVLAADEHHRPMSEMQGGCEAFSIPLAAELKAWNGKAVGRNAAASERGAVPVLPFGRLVSLKLVSESAVKLPVPPEKNFPTGAASFAGVSVLTVPRDGAYKLSLGGKVWLDVIDPKARQPLAADTFEMQTKCPAIFKVVVFSLKAGTRYWVQISSSPKEELRLLVTQNKGR